jgi:hypothetical protein
MRPAHASAFRRPTRGEPRATTRVFLVPPFSAPALQRLPGARACSKSPTTGTFTHKSANRRGKRKATGRRGKGAHPRPTPREHRPARPTENGILRPTAASGRGRRGPVPRRGAFVGVTRARGFTATLRGNPAPETGSRENPVPCGWFIAHCSDIERTDGGGRSTPTARRRVIGWAPPLGVPTALRARRCRCGG